jgi:hypothetical protein
MMKISIEKKILDWLYDRKITLIDILKEHAENKTANSKGASYDLGALDESTYIQESLEEIFSEAANENK